MISIQIVSLTLSWLSICLRFYVKAFLVKQTTRDDWLLLLALVLFSGQLGCLIRANIFHDGHSTLSPYAWQMFMLAAHGLNLTAAAFLKTSLAMTLMRFLASRWQRMTIVTITIIFNVYVTAQIFANIFACGLPSQLGNKQTIQECVNWQSLKTLSHFSAVFNATTDWTYILLPALAIWRSNLPRKVKISCSFITLIGLASGIAAVVRAIYSGGFNGFHRRDGSEVFAIFAAVFELTFGFIATSLLCSTTLLAHFSNEPTMNAAPDTTTRNPKEEEVPEFIKLSPIIYQQKSPNAAGSGVDGTRDRSIESTSAVYRADHFSWSRVLTSPPAGTSPGHCSIVLLIDEPSDDETEEEPVLGRVTKRPYSSV